MKMNHGFFLKYLFIGTLVMLFLNSVFGQEPNSTIPIQNESNYSIDWISQYPVIKDKKESDNRERKSRKNSNWFTDLIFGKKAGDLVKPMSVIAINPDIFWVADQGIGSLWSRFSTELKN